MEKATKEAAQTKEKDDEKRKPFLQRIGADMNILREFQGGFWGDKYFSFGRKKFGIVVWFSLSVYLSCSVSFAPPRQVKQF